MSLALASSISVLGLDRVCLRWGYPWPWPRIFFVSLASSLVSSTPPLVLGLGFFRVLGLGFEPSFLDSTFVFLELKPRFAKLNTRGGVEDTRLEAKAKDTKKIRGQGQPFRGQTLSRPRTGMLKAKDQGHKRKCSPKKRGLHKNFSSDLTKKRFPKKFSSASQNFNNSKNSAVLEPRTGQFSRT